MFEAVLPDKDIYDSKEYILYGTCTPKVLLIVQFVCFFFFLSIPSFSVPRESRVTTLAGPWPFEQFLCLAE